jgi:hypothetical protein
VPPPHSAIRPPLRLENAFQALALDEHREDFVPTLWNKLPDAPATQRLEQVWFPGAHSNVGGGYANTGYPMSHWLGWRTG